MDGVVWPRGKLVRYLREDVATDSLVEVWLMIYWGLHGHAAAPWLAGEFGSP